MNDTIVSGEAGKGETFPFIVDVNSTNFFSARPNTLLELGANAASRRSPAVYCRAIGGQVWASSVRRVAVPALVLARTANGIDYQRASFYNREYAQL